MRSVPTTVQGSSSRTISTSSEALSPHGSGAPVPGASDGASTSTAIVAGRGERVPAELGQEASDGLDRVDGVRWVEVRRLPPVLLPGARPHAHLVDTLGR